MAMMTTPRIVPPVPLRFIPDLVYGEMDGKPLLLDMVAPLDEGETARPVIIWIHGFGWFAGTRRDNLEISMCTFFAAHGFVAASVEYRLSDEATFPAQLHDVKGAVRWLRANAGTYGIDPERIGISGGSAGGTLAALAGLTGDRPDLEGWSASQPFSSRVQAVAVASAPSDFLRPGGAMRNDIDGPVSWLFGGTVNQKADLMRVASPIAHVRADAPPSWSPMGRSMRRCRSTRGSLCPVHWRMRVLRSSSIRSKGSTTTGWRRVRGSPAGRTRGNSARWRFPSSRTTCNAERFALAPGETSHKRPFVEIFGSVDDSDAAMPPNDCTTAIGRSRVHCVR